MDTLSIGALKQPEGNKNEDENGGEGLKVDRSRLS